MIVLKVVLLFYLIKLQYIKILTAEQLGNNNAVEKIINDKIGKNAVNAVDNEYNKVDDEKNGIKDIIGEPKVKNDIIFKNETEFKENEAGDDEFKREGESGEEIEQIEKNIKGSYKIKHNYAQNENFHEDGEYYQLVNSNAFNIPNNILIRSLHIVEIEDAIDEDSNGDQISIVDIDVNYDDIFKEIIARLNVPDLSEKDQKEDPQRIFEAVSNRKLNPKILCEISERVVEDLQKANDDFVEVIAAPPDFDLIYENEATDVRAEELKLSNDYYFNHVATNENIHEELNANKQNEFDYLKLRYTRNSSERIDSSLIEKKSVPLFLTPYIEANLYKLGQKLSYVKPFIGNIHSYAGYFTVDSRFHSNSFFWFFPCEIENFEKKPVLLWLQGGPGGSSLFGLFYENGPYEIKNDKLYRNPYSWTRYYNVLYIDNPVGTGFSFTSKNGYAQNQTIIGQHLYEAVKQFYMLFPNLKGNPFYITGESYAGKYIPALAFEIHNRNVLSHFKINLKGIFIGNGIIDPMPMLEYGVYLFETGLLDEYQRAVFHKFEQEIRLSIQNKLWSRAGKLFAALFFSSTNHNSLFRIFTGFNQHFNFNGLDFNTKDFKNFLNDKHIRDNLHVGEIKFGESGEVYRNLEQDIMKSELHKLNILVENYKVVLYYGQLDVICPYRLSDPVFHKIQFSGAYDYYKAKRKIWTYERFDDEDNVVGYIREAHNFVEVLIRNAGHMVPRDQPQFMIDLLKKYID